MAGSVAETQFNPSVGTTECPVTTVVSTLHKNPVIGRNWIKLAKGLGTPARRIEKFSRDLQMKKITCYDVITDVTALWAGRNGTRATLSKLFHTLEIEFEGECAETEETLRLELNLPPSEALSNPNITWIELSPAYQDKVRNNLCTHYQNLMLEEVLPKLKGSILISLMTRTNIDDLLFRQTIPDSLSYYVKRSVLHRNVISDKIFWKYSPDLYLFTGIERNHLVQLSQKSQSEVEDSGEQIGRVTAKFIILEDDTHFEKICGKVHCPVHWLHYDNGGFVWIRSEGSVNLLRNSIDEQQQANLNEDEFYAKLKPDSNQPICIADSPGIGKTIFLREIGRRLSQLFPERNIIFVVLSEFIQQFKHISGSSLISKIEQVLLSIASDNEIGKLIIKLKLRSQLKVEIELLVDGFDEVNQRDSELALKILETIKSSFNSIRLWVTSRPHFLQELETTLSTFSYTLKPFEEVEQVRFLTLYWSSGAFETKGGGTRLDKFANNCLKILNSVNSSTNSKDKDIAGIPLQCLLVGEVYEEEARAFANYGGMGSPSVFINSMTDLYKFTIARKFQKYLAVHGPCGSEQEQTSDSLLDMHARLALELIFPDIFEKVHNLFGGASLQQMVKVGIVEACRITGVPRFVHRTFAEYFVAFSLLSSSQEMKESYLETSMIIIAALSYRECTALTIYDKINSFQFTNPVVTYFLNSLIGEGHSISTRPLHHFATSHDHQQCLRQITHSCATAGFVKLFLHLKNACTLNKLEEAKIFDQDLLWLALEYSNVEFLKAVLEYFERHNNFDVHLQTKVLCLAVRRGEFSILEFLIKRRQLGGTVLELNDGTGKLLHLLMEYTADEDRPAIDKKIQMIRFLVGVNPKLLEERDTDGRTPLLARLAHVELQLELLRLGANVLAQNKNAETVLHSARTNARLTSHVSPEEYHRLLLAISNDQLVKMVHVKDKNGDSSLTKLIKDTDPLPASLEKYRDCGADFNIDTDGLSLLGTAIQGQRNMDTLRKLTECGSSLGWKGSEGESLLHLAGHLGNVEASLFLVDEQGMEINVEDVTGLTPLDYAVKSHYERGNRLKTCLALKERGGILKQDLNPKGQSPFHLAGDGGNGESVQFLLQSDHHGVNSADVDGNSPLHLLMMNTRLEAKQWINTAMVFLDSNADLKLLNKSGESPIDLLAKNPNLNIETIQMLQSKRGIKFPPSFATAAMKTLLWKGCDMADDDFIKCFSEFAEVPEIDFKHEDEEGNSMLHLAASEGHARAVLLLIDKGVYVNSINKHEQTALHLASKFWGKCSLDMIKYLVDHGCDASAKDDEGNIFLHIYLNYNGYFNSSPSKLHSFVEYLIEQNLTFLFDIPSGNMGMTGLQICMGINDMNEDTLELLHSSSVNFNAIDCDGYSVLAHAIRAERSIPFLSALINRFGANPKQINKITGDNILHITSGWGRPDTVKFILELDMVDINGRNHDGDTPLHLGLPPKGHNLERMEICRLLTGWGADVNVANNRQQGPLHRAALLGDKTMGLEVIKILDKNGADVFARDDDNSTFVHNYMEGTDSTFPVNFHSMVEFLVGNGYTGLLEAPGGESQITPLQFAILNVDVEMRTLSLMHTTGITFNNQYETKKSILSYAVSGGRSARFLSFLIGNGADWKQFNEDGRNLLHIAAHEGTVELLKFVLDLGGLDVNGLDENGEAPLHLAVLEENETYVIGKSRLLIDNGAKSNILNREGSTPLSIAMKKSYPFDKKELIKLLQGGNASSN